ncbi:Aste57867_2265 [Aphanomyces stellatus]|uniref:Aste57867_2265 protein n=1 Tax=Aphanomyces stellatus TaxID=120398 RepID=A0A485KCU8_9STRA|nr:hypothetical protein As57867_002260 [Aphanomyces stellatus]VFT79468.1 Aste57867_2265 [Aphanomyces stellatus]
MSQKLPLPRGFFHCPPLSSEEIATYKYLAHKNAMDLVRKAQLHGGDIAWTLVSDDDDSVKLYRGEDLACEPGYSLHCGVLEVQGTMSEVISLFCNPAHDARWLPPGTIDTTLLHTIVAPTDDLPRQKLTLSWRALSSKFAHMAKRDDVFLEVDYS